MAAGDESFLGIGAIHEDALSQSRDLRQRVTVLYEAHRNEIYRFLVGQGLGLRWPRRSRRTCLSIYFLP